MLNARERLLLLGGSIASLSTSAAFGADTAGGEAPARPRANDEVAAAWAQLHDAIGQCGQFVQSHYFYEAEENRASAYAMIIATLIGGLEMNTIFDTDFPYFTIHDNRIHAGVDNPDQRYSSCNIRGGAAYRVWGTLGSATRLEFQVYAGAPFAVGGGGSPSAMMFEELRVNPDGTFEVYLSPEKQVPNWLSNPPSATRLLVRKTFGTWNDADPGQIHIDRLGMEGEPKPAVSTGDMAARLRAAADDLLISVKGWPNLLPQRFGTPAKPADPREIPMNVLPPPFEAQARGAAKGRLTVFGAFELEPDEALIVRAWPYGTSYQGVQLNDVWGSSLEYGNRQTSLTNAQASLSRDGSYWFVVSARDPGIVNWLDTTGLRHGQICFRIDGLQTAPPASAKPPTTQKVKFADLKTHLPSDIPKVSPQQRSQELARRRRHVQVRCNN